MKIVTSVTLFGDAVGVRMSITYSEVNSVGQITADNKRIDRVVAEPDLLSAYANLKTFAQTAVDQSE